jgi:hypothetical protein
MRWKSATRKEIVFSRNPYLEVNNMADEKDKGGKKAAVAESNFIWVKSTRDDERVAFYEKDARHPVLGEAFVYGKKAFRVYKTDATKKAILDGRIVEVEAPATEEKAQPAEV